MSKIIESLDVATMFIEQIEQEFSDLIHSYHIGSPRSDGIWKKVNGVKDALITIEKEIKVVEAPKIVTAPVAPKPEVHVATAKPQKK
jgi:hypothetical protein